MNSFSLNNLKVALKPAFKSPSASTDNAKKTKASNNVVCITSTDEFKHLKKDWNELVAKSTNPNPFILWEWMFTWWETYQRKGKDTLCILATYHQKELVAIAPFYIKSQGAFIKRLSLLGEGENEDDIIVTTYPDIIAQEKYLDACVADFAKYISNPPDNFIKFNYASFNLLREGSVLQKVGAKLSKDFTSKRMHSENQFVIKLPKTEEDYDATLSKSTKKQFRMKLNRMKKVGDVEITSCKKLLDGLTIMEKLHRARWFSTTEPNAFDSTKFLQFHQTLCARLQNQKILDFRIMRHDGNPIAVAYNFNYQQACYSYMSGFQSTDDKRFSPMFIFDMLEIKNLIKLKYHCYDMLVSESENNYKTKFGSEVNSVYSLHWFRKGLFSTAMLSFMKIKPTLSKYYHFFIK